VLDQAYVDNRELLKHGLGRERPRLVPKSGRPYLPAATSTTLPLNGSAHYVNRVQHGFRNAIKAGLDAAFDLVLQQRKGQPEDEHLEDARLRHSGDH